MQDQDGESSNVCQFCGTAFYVSPEVLHDRPASRASDLWALGCLIFQEQLNFCRFQCFSGSRINDILLLLLQMFTGRAPFVAENDYLTFQMVRLTVKICC